MARLLAAAVLALLALPAATLAQTDTVAVEVPLRGMVWTPPDDPRAAEADLRAMQRAGVTAVRMPLSEHERVYRAATALELRLFVDLPIAALPAAHLRDTLAFASGQLEALLALAERHPSIAGVGLAQGVDTSEEAACGYFTPLAERARAAGLLVYYRSRFIESDLCSRAVDFVLLEARGRDPVALLRRWRNPPPGTGARAPAGIGALGVDVSDGVSGGHLTPRSPAAQARFLENSLRELRRVSPAPAGVFVHRWRSQGSGLHDEEGTPRPAAAVVEGFFTGRQLVFAVDAGEAPSVPPGAAPFITLGWLLAIGLILLLSFAPRFRQLIPRYFERHGYYRESVQRSAGLEGFAAVAVALALSMAAGLVIGVILYSLTMTDALEAAVAGFGERQQEDILARLRQPGLTVALGGVVYALWLMLNMVWLLALSGKRYRVRPLQAAVLSAFSRWPVFVLAVLALLAAQGDNPVRWLPALLGLWVAIEFVAAVRMLYDYSRVSRVPMPRAIVAGMGAPLALLAVLALVVATQAGPTLTFLWHMATRT